MKTITSSDIAVVRQLKNPPRLIRQIMDCALVLFARPLKHSIDYELQGPSPSWESSLRVCIKDSRIVTRENFFSIQFTFIFFHL